MLTSALGIGRLHFLTEGALAVDGVLALAPGRVCSVKAEALTLRILVHVEGLGKFYLGGSSDHHEQGSLLVGVAGAGRGWGSNSIFLKILTRFLRLWRLIPEPFSDSRNDAEWTPQCRIELVLVMLSDRLWRERVRGWGRLLIPFSSCIHRLCNENVKFAI